MILCSAGPFGMKYGLHLASPFQLVHHPNWPVHMGLCSILSGRLIWADTMLCPAGPFEMVCCICPAGPYGMVQGFFRLAHMRQYDIMFGQSISTGTPSQPAGSYGIVLNLIRPAYSRQQNPYNVLYFLKDISIAQEGNIINP